MISVILLLISFLIAGTFFIFVILLIKLNFYGIFFNETHDSVLWHVHLKITCVWSHQFCIIWVAEFLCTRLVTQ